MTPIEEGRGLGGICGRELRRAGISTLERLQELGWEEALMQWTAMFPSRINVNAAVGLIAAIQGIHWLKVSPGDKERARRMVKRLRLEVRG